MTECPHCQKTLVLFSGPEQADILLAGEFPGIREIESGIPFKGPAGDILRNEVFRLNIFKYGTCRVGNLWQHERFKGCLPSWHRERFMEEFVRHKFCLLMGSEFGNGVIYPGGVMERCGLAFRHESGVQYVVSTNPAGVTKAGGSVGEFREALRTFGKLVKGEIECLE